MEGSGRTDQERRPSSRSAPTSSFVVQHSTRSCLFKLVTPAQIMEELAHLVRLEAIVLDEAGPKTFVKAADVSIGLDA